MGDTPGKSKKSKQMRIAFARIDKQEFLETVKTTTDETKKRKISSDVEDESTIKSPKVKPKKCKTDIPPSEAASKPKLDDDLKPSDVSKKDSTDISSNVKIGSTEQESKSDDTLEQEKGNEKEPVRDSNETPEVVEESDDEPMDVDAVASTPKLQVSAPNE